MLALASCSTTAHPCYAHITAAGTRHLLLQPSSISRSGPSPYLGKCQRLGLLPPRRYARTAVPPSASGRRPPPCAVREQTLTLRTRYVPRDRGIRHIGHPFPVQN